SSVEVRRELASLLSHVPHTGLAERVFRTAGYLKLMTAAHRRLWERVGSQNGVALVAKWFCEIARSQESSCTLRPNYRLTEGVLRSSVKLLDLTLCTRRLEFLQENSEISGNWNRLHDLLVSYQEDTIIPDHWTTIINVTALDERKKPVPDFKKRLSEERARQAAEEAAKNTRVLDLTRPDTGIPDSQSKSPRYRVYSSKSPVQTLSPKRPFTSDLRNLKRRPSGHQPVEDSVLSANASTTVAKSDVYKKLPGYVVWKEVRPDLRQALLSGVTYDKAMEWLASDKEAHSLFSSPVLVQMLVSVIFSRHLDSTLWTKYVPEVYYQMADEVVDRHILAGTEPAAWGDLDRATSNLQSTTPRRILTTKILVSSTPNLRTMTTILGMTRLVTATLGVTSPRAKSLELTSQESRSLGTRSPRTRILMTIHVLAPSVLVNLKTTPTLRMDRSFLPRGLREAVRP
ncbi:Hypothetical protein PHPALM_19206, partial [Phytophthora palmivora]